VETGNLSILSQSKNFHIGIKLSSEGEVFLVYSLNVLNVVELLLVELLAEVLLILVPVGHVLSTCIGELLHEVLVVSVGFSEVRSSTSLLALGVRFIGGVEVADLAVTLVEFSVVFVVHFADICLVAIVLRLEIVFVPLV